MKKFFSTLLIASTLMSVSYQTTQAAWVIGVASSYENSDFADEVNRLAYRTAVVSGILGLLTGSQLMSTIFVLSDEDVNVSTAEQIRAKFSHFKELKDSEVFNDMAKQASLVGGTKDALTIELKDGQEVKLADGQTVKLTGDKSLAVDTKVISIDGKTMDSLLEKNGIDLSSNGAKALKAFVK